MDEHTLLSVQHLNGGSLVKKIAYIWEVLA